MTAIDSRSQLLAELAAGPARRGYAIAYDLLGNRGEAEDAVQEALARACERIDELREPAAAAGWFLRIVTTTALRVLRRRRLRRALFGRFERTQPDDDQDHGGDRGMDDDVVMQSHGQAAPTAPTALAEREQVLALLRSLDGLASKQRAALVLRYGHGLPVVELAQLMGVEPATAKTHLVRGLARLRAHLAEEQTV